MTPNEIRFRAFLAERGVLEDRVDVRDKIAWLDYSLASSTPPTFGALRYMAYDIRNFGANDAQNAHDYSVLLTLVRDAQGDERVAWSRPPSPAMPLQVLTKVISTLGDTFIDFRWKCEFLFGWWAGFPPITIRRLTRATTAIAGDGSSLRVTWKPATRRIRSILIPRARNPQICLIRALQDWFARSNIPDDPTVLLFPRSFTGRAPIML